MDRDDSANGAAGGRLHPRLLSFSEWCGCCDGVVEIGNSFAGKPECGSIPVRVSQSAVLIFDETKHGDVIVCATTACLRARLRTAPIRSRERQRADAQLLMTFCLATLQTRRGGASELAGSFCRREISSRSL